MLRELILAAYDTRSTLLERLHLEGTNAYRLFHGTNEGVPGLTVDRYGELLLVQSFHQSLSEIDLQVIKDVYSELLTSPFIFVYNDRSSANSRYSNRLVEGEREEANRSFVFQELGVNYAVKARHKGQDPYLFLDFRAARRYVLANSQNSDVLNLFSYTCGMGICAGVGGAKDVVNVDFAESSLAIGAENARLNHLDDTSIQFIQADFFTAARQMAGLPVAMRRGRQSHVPKYEKIQPRQFDLVILDPPKWAKSPFGTVDLVRDYSSVFKPALLCTREGGTLLCANNVAQVELSSWLELLQRSAKKAGRPIKNIEVVTPENDFPSRDGHFPLKMAVLEV